MLAEHTLSDKWNPNRLYVIQVPLSTSFPGLYKSVHNHSCPTINSLNDDCLDMIFSHFNLIDLFYLTFVCKRWYHLCNDQISRSKYFSTETFENVPIKWEKSQYMYPFPSNESVLSVLHLTQANLKTLSLSNVPDLSAEDLSLCGDLLLNLRELELCGSFNPSPSMVQAIACKFCPRLESLSLQSCHLEHLDLLLQNAAKLKYLSISGSELDEETEEVFPVHECIPSDCPLTSICFYRFPKLHISSIDALLRSFSETLTYINLSYTYIQDIAGMAPDLPQLPNIKIFIAPVDPISSGRNMLCSPERSALMQMQHSLGVVAMLKLMPNLQILDLSNSNLITYAVANFVDVLVKHCPMLEELYLVSCFIPAKEFLSLKYLVHLKRLFLDHNQSNSTVPSFLLDFAYDYAATFRFIVNHVISHLKELQTFSLTNYQWVDCKRTIRCDDLVHFLRNAGPKFENIFLTAAKTEEHGKPYDFVTKALSMCGELSKTININIENTLSYDIGKASTIMKYFDSIAPSYIQVKFSNYFEKKYALCDDYLKLPNF
ncbi:hypothetical protein ACHWQZ_G013931 [Mnemiopsis leidyi]